MEDENNDKTLPEGENEVLEEDATVSNGAVVNEGDAEGEVAEVLEDAAADEDAAVDESAVVDEGTAVQDGTTVDKEYVVDEDAAVDEDTAIDKATLEEGADVQDGTAVDEGKGAAIADITAAEESVPTDEGVTLDKGDMGEGDIEDEDINVEEKEKEAKPKGGLVEELKSEDEISILTEYYDPEDFLSSAILSPNGTIPIDIFSPLHSFGYDCQRYYNLCACDDNVVAWAAGSYITFYDTITKKVFFRRSSTGGSIGHIVKNPNPELSHIAVGEGGLKRAEPVILIYEWPTMTIVAVLREGTQNSYANLDYSPDGGLLASVGGAPDYNLTIWDWQKHRIMLQTSAFSFTVNNVQFSPYIPGQLSTSGASHVKFWKMCPTFTGLKLKGELGRFGKTEICDILGVMPMPDEKVLSGSSWGNILVWEGGLIKVEVCQRGRNTCHQAPITQFLRSAETAEVTTVGLDGRIRTWYWDTVEQSDPPENDPFIELNPVAELVVEGAQLMSISHRRKNEWFGQDAGGCIWSLDLDVDSPDCIAPRREVRWHGSALAGLAVLRGSQPLLVTMGCDGTLALSAVPAGPLLYLRPPQGSASTMLYFPKKVDRTGRTLLVGYSDGTCRLLILLTKHLHEKMETIYDDSCVGLLQQVKPHNDAVRVISLNNACTTLVTASVDCTMFMYQLKSKNNVPELVPLCFIDTPKIINYIVWKPHHNLTVLLAGKDGLIMEAELPNIAVPPPPETITYKDFFVNTNIINLKEYFLRYTPPDEEEDMPFLGSDDEEEEEEEKKDDEDEEKGEEEPEVELMTLEKTSTKAILWALYDPLQRGQLWVAQQGLGCLLRIQPGALLPNKFAPLEDSWDTSIVSLLFTNQNRDLVLGMEDGEIRVIRFPTPEQDKSQEEFEIRMFKRQKKLKRKLGKPKDEPELIPRLDFSDFLRLPMHNNHTGLITHMVFSPDEKYFFTAGADGNVFSYEYNLEPELLREVSSFDFGKESVPARVGLLLTEEELELSHEELAREKERQTLLRAANEYKQRVKDQLAELVLEFKDWLKRNNSMPIRQQVEVTIDDRVLEEEEKAAGEKMALVRRRIAYPLAVSSLKLHKMMKRNIEQLEILPFQLNSIIEKSYNVKVIRQNKLPPQFFDDLEIVKSNLNKALLKAQMSVDKDEGDEEEEQIWDLEGPPAPLLQGLPPSLPPPRALVRALRDYLHRINHHHRQEMEWQEHLGRRSFESVELAGAAAIAEAEATIGEFHLKSKPVGQQGPSAQRADPAPLEQTHLELFITRQEMYEIQSKFNKSLVDLREEKSNLVKNYEKLTKRLAAIAEEIPKNLRQAAPLALPTMDPELEYPETNCELKKPRISRPHMGTVRRRSVFFTPPPIVMDESTTRTAAEQDPYFTYWSMMKDDSIEKKSTVETPLEKYYKERHITSLLVEQEQIIHRLKQSVEEWEAKLRETGRERERVQLRTQFLRLHLLYLTQRHLVLDSFQLREDEMGEHVRIQQAELKVAQDQLKVLQKSIEGLRSGIATNQEQIKQLEIQQKKWSNEAPKFAKFLRHVYKKKQKPPKTETDESSSESEGSESSSSSEEESEESGGEMEVRLRLDSTECPPGCDPQLFEEVVELRQIRYDIENDIKEQERQIEMSKKEVESKNREAKSLVRKLEERQKILYDLLQTKQALLNEIECVVVVAANLCASEALENVLKGGHACEGSGILLFPAPLIAQLKDRIAQLHAEALEQKKRHSINKLHLKHMRVDCQHMNQKLAALHTQCQWMLTKKLGLGELEGKNKSEITEATRASRLLDAVVTEMTQAFKVAAASGFTIDMQQQLAQWKEKECNLEQQYCAVLQEHTQKLRIASALQAETLSKTSSKQIKEMLGGRTEEEYRQDIVRLRRLRKEQRQQIEDLKAEIHRLKMKPLCSEGAAVLSPDTLGTHITSAMPSERATPRSYDPNIKLIATTLAKCLAESGIEVLADLNWDRCLLDEISQLLPLLIVGKLNINQAANKILKKLSLSCETEENIMRANQCRRCISGVFRQIVRENLFLGEMSPLVQVTPLPAVDAAEALQGTVRSLVEVGATPRHSQLIDAAVASLLQVHPQVAEQIIDAETLSSAVQEQMDEVDDILVSDIARAVIDCIIAQALEPGEETAIAKEITELQKTASATSIGSALKKSVSVTSAVSGLRKTVSATSAARRTSQTVKRVSVVDAKSETSLSAPTKGTSRTSAVEPEDDA